VHARTRGSEDVREEQLRVDARGVDTCIREPLLSKTKRMIKVRRRYPAFGRGSIEFLECGNRAALAFLRRHEWEVLVVVANLLVDILYSFLDPRVSIA